MLRPSYLQPADLIALIAPSGATSVAAIEAIEETIRGWGVIPVRGKYLLSHPADRAIRQKERLADWQWALDESSIRAIWCCGSGYGALSIVESADYSVFQGDPKWVIGMEDATVLHAKLNSLGIETVHSLLPETLQESPPDSVTALRNYLFGRVSAYRVEAHPLNRPGYAATEIFGGRLNWLHSLQDTPLAYPTRNTILFVEEAGQNLEEIERCLLCLKYGGKLQHLQGLVAGGFPGESPEWQEEAYRIIREITGEYHYPLLFGFPAGRSGENLPLLLGAATELVVNEEGGFLRFP